MTRRDLTMRKWVRKVRTITSFNANRKQIVATFGIVTFGEEYSGIAGVYSSNYIIQVPEKYLGIARVYPSYYTERILIFFKEISQQIIFLLGCCHSHGVGAVEQKLRHFLISLPLLKILI